MNVFMIASPRVDWSEYSRFVTSEDLPAGNAYSVEPPSDAESLIEICGRLCYLSYGKGRKTNAEFVHNIIDSQHFSVLEHSSWTFIITGVSRSLTHELVRHRHFSYSQLSQRYVDHSQVPSVMPAAIVGTPLEQEWRAHQEASRTLYKRVTEKLQMDMVTWTTTDRKTAMGSARSVLTEATETKIAVTGNARAWREFIQKRMNPHADAEIRALARMILDRLWQSAPELFRDLMPEEA